MNDTITINQLTDILNNAKVCDYEIFIDGYEYTFGIHSNISLTPIHEHSFLPIIELDSIKEIFVVCDVLELHLKNFDIIKSLSIKSRIIPTSLLD